MESILPELIATVVVPLLGAAVVAFRKWLKANIAPSQLSAVNQLARIAVDASDELARATDGVPGNEKYEMAASFVHEAARHVGIKLTDDEAAGFIHAALYGKRNEIDAAVEAVLDEVLGDLVVPEDVEDDKEAA